MASGENSKAAPYDDLKQISAAFGIQHVLGMIFLHNGIVLRARHIQELRHYIGYGFDSVRYKNDYLFWFEKKLCHCLVLVL